MPVCACTVHAQALRVCMRACTYVGCVRVHTWMDMFVCMCMCAHVSVYMGMTLASVVRTPVHAFVMVRRSALASGAQTTCARWCPPSTVGVKCGAQRGQISRALLLRCACSFTHHCSELSPSGLRHAHHAACIAEPDMSSAAYRAHSSERTSHASAARLTFLAGPA